MRTFEELVEDMSDVIGELSDEELYEISSMLEGLQWEIDDILRDRRAVRELDNWND